MSRIKPNITYKRNDNHYKTPDSENQVRLSIHRLIEFINDHVKSNNHEMIIDKKVEITQRPVNHIEDYPMFPASSGEYKKFGKVSKNISSFIDPFLDSLRRWGTPETINGNTLYSAIIGSFHVDFLKSNKMEQEKCISKFIEKMISDIYVEKLFDKYEYTCLGWNVRDLITDLKIGSENRTVLRFISDYLNINILLMHLEEDTLYGIYNGDIMNRFRNTICLVYINNHFELVEYNGETIFKYDSAIIRKIVHVKGKSIIPLHVNLNNDEPIPIAFGYEDLSIYINTNTIPIKEIESNEQENVIIIEEDTKDQDFEVSIKMKLNEIQEIAKNKGISIHTTGMNGKNKNKTKKQLIDEIMQ